MGGYGLVRDHCGLQPLPDSFDNLNLRPPELSLESWQKLASVYQDPSDIELYPGGLSELPVDPGRLGATFSCIIGMVSNIRIFIRIFFWENYSLFQYFFTKYWNNTFLLNKM
jgi:hypothetical protein